MPNQKHTNMKTAWLAGFLFLSNQCVSDQRTQDVPGQLHESLKASSPNEKPFSPTVVKPHARKLAKASRRSCERPGKNERTFEQPPYAIAIARWQMSFVIYQESDTAQGTFVASGVAGHDRLGALCPRNS